MPATEKRTFGLTAPQERDAALEHRLRKEVARAYDSWKANPGSAITPKALDERMRKRHEARAKNGARSGGRD